MVAGVQPVKIGNAVNAKQHRFAVKDERGLAVPESRFDNQRVTIGPVMAIAGKQPSALALALDDDAIAVIFDFVNPVRSGRDLGAPTSNAGQVLKLTQHARKIDWRCRIASRAEG